MSHPDEGVLQELLDGELAPADAAAVRAHLAGCPPCTAAFDELKALQVDADAIVARLPLDPPLALPARSAPRSRALNLRLIGLAASTLLVAGTSWILFRSNPGPAMLTDSRGDTGAGVALPMPTEERKEVEPEPNTPAARQDAAPPAAVDPGFQAKTLTKPAAPAPQELQKQEVPQKDTSADDARRANVAEPADAPAPLASAAAPPAAARLAGGAMKRAAIQSTTVAEAESRLGARLRTIEGLTPVSVEVLPLSADSLPTVRQRYLVDGVPVMLVQQVSPALARDEVTSKEKDVAPEAAAAQRVRVPSGLVAGQPATRSWDAWGNHFMLQGALPADSIDALVKRVK